MKRITEYDPITTVAENDVVPIVDVSDTEQASTGSTRKGTIATIADYIKDRAETLTNKTLGSPLFQGTWDGWIDANETWTYASADDPTYTFTISGDLSSKYSAGMRIKLTQTTVKYFIITKVAYSSPNTTITVYGGTDYDLANATITNPYYSMVKAPQGFPLSPEKWTVTTTSTSTASGGAIANVWYNLGTITISLPIGVWDVYYKVIVQVTGTTGDYSNTYASLSTANNSASDSHLTTFFFSIQGTSNLVSTHTCEKVITRTSKATYYLVEKTDQNSTSIGLLSNYGDAVIRATCAYL